MHRTCAAFALLVLSGFAAPAADAPPAPKANPDPKSLEVAPDELSRARELVQKLSSEGFREREEAERELAAMGRLARAALLDGVNADPDPEVRHRCSALLPRATAEEMQARLDTFLADTENRYDHNLPGWQKLRAAVRGEWKFFGRSLPARPELDRAARELFIEFIQAPGGRQAMAAVDQSPEELGRFVSTRKQEIYDAKYRRRGAVASHNPTVPELMAVFFAESQVDSRLVPKSMVLTGLLQQAGVPGVVQGASERAKAMRAVLTAWLDSRTDPADVYSAMTLARSTLNDPAAAGRLAGRLLEAKGLTGYQKGYAVTYLVQLGLKDKLPAIEKAMTDTTVVSTTIRVVGGKQVRESVEVRDVALLGAIVLTGQKPEDYGFDSIAGAGTPASFSYSRARIPDEKRKGAAEMWKEWREKNP